MFESLPHSDPILRLFLKHFLQQIEKILGKSLILLLLELNLAFFVVL